MPAARGRSTRTVTSLARQASRPALFWSNVVASTNPRRAGDRGRTKGQEVHSRSDRAHGGQSCRSERRSVPAQRIFADGDAPLRPGQLRAGAESIAQIPRSRRGRRLLQHSPGDVGDDCRAAQSAPVIAKPDGSSRSKHSRRKWDVFAYSCRACTTRDATSSSSSSTQRAPMFDSD